MRQGPERVFDTDSGIRTVRGSKEIRAADSPRPAAGLVRAQAGRMARVGR